jgi:hypothetical protein
MQLPWIKSPIGMRREMLRGQDSSGAKKEGCYRVFAYFRTLFG